MYDKEKWIQVFKRYNESKLVISKFCLQEKITLDKFKYYRQKLKSDGYYFETNNQPPKKILEDKIKYWKNIFEDFISSNLSIKQYCRNNNISRDAFRYWKDKLQVIEDYSFDSPYDPIHNAIKKQNSTFIEFDLKDIENDKTSRIFKLNLNEFVLKIDTTQNDSFIKLLIKELQKLV